MTSSKAKRATRQAVDLQIHRKVEHLRARFRERWNLELTRELRLDMLDQIHSGRAQQVARYPNGIEVWEVSWYNTHRAIREFFQVLYERRYDQMLTVLPPVESKEFAEFCTRAEQIYGISRHALLTQRKTGRDLEAESLAALRYDEAYERLLRRRAAVAWWKTYCQARKHIAPERDRG